MKKYIPFLITLFLLAPPVLATDLSAYTGGWNTTSIQVPENGSQQFFTNLSIFTNRIYFYYSEGMLRISLQAPNTIGDYQIPIWANRTWNMGNFTSQNYTTSNVYVDTIFLKVIENITPSPTPFNESECGSIKISLIGVATRGKMAIVRTSDKNGKAIVATVTIQDTEGNAQVIETNNPTTGFGSFKIADDSDVPVTLIAFREGCESGTYLINELKGEKLTKEEDIPTNKTMGFTKTGGEELVNNVYNNTLIDDTSQPLSGVKITIVRPCDTANVNTNTDNNGFFSVYLNCIGEWNFRAEKDGYGTITTSVKSRNPRREIEIHAFMDSMPVSSGIVYAGRAVEFGIYSGGELINDTLTGKVSTTGISAFEGSITFDKGKGKYTFLNDGDIRITVDQSENYLPASIILTAVAGIDFVFIGAIILIVLIIALVIVVVIKRLDSGRPSVSMGNIPQEVV